MKRVILLFLLITGNLSFAQLKPDKHIEEFFKVYSNDGVNKALDFLYLESPWKDNIADAINEQKSKLSAVDKQLGKLYGKVKIAEKDVKDTFIAIHYLVKYEREPLRFEFKYYKPDNHWVLYGFSFDGGLSQELTQSLNIQILEMKKDIK